MVGSRQTCVHVKMGEAVLVVVMCVVLTMVVGGVRGQASDCSLDDVTVMDGFQISKFLGQWYEIEWIATTYQDNGNSWINYYHVYTADRYGVVTGYSSGKDPNSGQCFLGGLVNLKTTDHPAKLKQYTERKKIIIDYWVVDTDYESYAIVYSCVDRANDANNTCSTPRSWTWSRTKSLPDTVKQTARDIFDRLCMNSTLLYVTGFAGEDCDPDTTRSVASTTMNGNLIFVQILIVMLLMFFNMETLS